MGDSGHALIPFLEPLASKFAWMNDISMGLMALYASMTIGSAYGEKLVMNGRTAGLLGLSAFVVITSGPEEGLATGNWNASGLFVSMVVSLLAVRIFSLFIEKGFTIKLPEQVPPAIGNSFAAIVPYAVVLGICWLIRTMLNIDLVAVLMGLLAPLVAGADNIFVFMGSTLVQQLLWIVGLHVTTCGSPTSSPSASCGSKRTQRHLPTVRPSSIFSTCLLPTVPVVVSLAWSSGLLPLGPSSS